jgi:hypothetical protein
MMLNIHTYTYTHTYIHAYIHMRAGHGHFLRSLDGQQFDALALRCCSTLLVPPMENDLPLYAENVRLPESEFYHVLLV